MNSSLRRAVLMLSMSLAMAACNAQPEPRVDAARAVTVVAVRTRDVTLSQEYAGEIQSHHRIDVRAPNTGTLAEVAIETGQAVHQGDVLFQIQLSSEEDEDGNLFTVRAAFDGQIGRLLHSQGGRVKQGEALTTLSDDSVMTVEFRVPEAQYLAFQSAKVLEHPEDLTIGLLLANGEKFDQPGHLNKIGAGFNHQTGTVSFYADFPNPDRLLRHDQTTVVLMSEVERDALVVPQRATFEILGKRYVFVVDEHDVARQREIVVQDELEDLFIIQSGVNAGDKLVLEGARQVRDGKKVTYDDR